MQQQLVTELGYVGFEVSDLARWERYASDVLGLGVRAGPGGTLLARMDGNDRRIICTSGPADDLAFAGWQTSDAGALQRFAEHLDRLGVAYGWGSDAERGLRGVERFLHFADPAGNRHEVYFGPLLATTRFCSPRVASGFVTGAGGMGHIVFESAEPARHVEFLQRVLGARMTDQIHLRLSPEFMLDVAFMHVNQRHHSVAVAPRPPGSTRRLHHFMLEVGAVDDVGFARDRCLAMGLAVGMDIGQHPNDRMISFYGKTPSGFSVEFGWGAVLVDDATWQVSHYGHISEWGHRPNSEVAAPPPAAAASTVKERPMSVSGAWNVVIKTPMGDNAVVFDLQADGGKLFGTIKGASESNAVTDGSIDGNQLRWKSKVSSPLPMDLEFSASIDGDSISGGAKSPFGTAPFSGSRAG